MTSLKIKLAAVTLGVIGGLLPQHSFAAGPADDFKVELTGYWGINSHFPSLKSDPAIDSQILEGAQIGGAQATITGGSDFKWTAGGGVAIPLTHSLFVTGESGYQRMGSVNFGLSSGQQSAMAGASLSVTQFTGGVQYLIGDPNHGIVPYVSGGIGAARQALSATASSVGASATASQTTATEYVGAGVRFKLSSSVGIRPEFRIVHLPIDSTLGVPGSWYMSSEVGLYWRFGR